MPDGSSPDRLSSPDVASRSVPEFKPVREPKPLSLANPNIAADQMRAIVDNPTPEQQDIIALRVEPKLFDGVRIRLDVRDSELARREEARKAHVENPTSSSAREDWVRAEEAVKLANRNVREAARVLARMGFKQEPSQQGDLTAAEKRSVGRMEAGYRGAQAVDTGVRRARGAARTAGRVVGESAVAARQAAAEVPGALESLGREVVSDAAGAARRVGGAADRAVQASLRGAGGLADEGGRRVSGAVDTSREASRDAGRALESLGREVVSDAVGVGKRVRGGLADLGVNAAMGAATRVDRAAGGVARGARRVGSVVDRRVQGSITRVGGFADRAPGAVASSVRRVAEAARDRGLSPFAEKMKAGARAFAESRRALGSAIGERVGAGVEAAGRRLSADWRNAHAALSRRTAGGREAFGRAWDGLAARMESVASPVLDSAAEIAMRAAGGVDAVAGRVAREGRAAAAVVGEAPGVLRNSASELEGIAMVGGLRTASMYDETRRNISGFVKNMGVEGKKLAALGGEMWGDIQGFAKAQAESLDKGRKAMLTEVSRRLGETTQKAGNVLKPHWEAISARADQTDQHAARVRAHLDVFLASSSDALQPVFDGVLDWGRDTRDAALGFTSPMVQGLRAFGRSADRWAGGRVVSGLEFAQERWSALRGFAVESRRRLNFFMENAAPAAGVTFAPLRESAAVRSTREMYQGAVKTGGEWVKAGRKVPENVGAFLDSAVNWAEAKTIEMARVMDAGAEAVRAYQAVRMVESWMDRGLPTLDVKRRLALVRAIADVSMSRAADAAYEVGVGGAGMALAAARNPQVRVGLLVGVPLALALLNHQGLADYASQALSGVDLGGLNFADVLPRFGEGSPAGPAFSPDAGVGDIVGVVPGGAESFAGVPAGGGEFGALPPDVGLAPGAPDLGDISSRFEGGFPASTVPGGGELEAPLPPPAAPAAAPSALPVTGDGTMPVEVGEPLAAGPEVPISAGPEVGSIRELVNSIRPGYPVEDQIARLAQDAEFLGNRTEVASALLRENFLAHSQAFRDSAQAIIDGAAPESGKAIARAQLDAANTLLRNWNDLPWNDPQQERALTQLLRQAQHFWSR